MEGLVFQFHALGIFFTSIQPHLGRECLSGAHFWGEGVDDKLDDLDQRLKKAVE